VLDPAQLPGVLTGAEIRGLLSGAPPLVSGLADADLQVQPHGLDVRLESVWRPTAAGRIGLTAREIPPREGLPFESDGWQTLPAGGYVVRLCETVCLPKDVMALGFARSSLLRAGCGLQTAVWDAGYHGRSEALLVVANPAGLRVERGARIAQLVFFRLAAPTVGYSGAFQGEHLGG
jgi:dUTP pyrophosphatase